MFQSYWGNRALKAYSWVLLFLLAALSFGSYFLDVSQDNEFHTFIIFIVLIFGTPLICGLMMIYYSRNTLLGLRVFFTFAASGLIVAA
ncbi:MAG: ABC-type arginine/histidine transport system permease subunit [Paraglaciecola sp.]|jgi:ABC-type arginine/histidine transport system permease subunit